EQGRGALHGRAARLSPARRPLQSGTGRLGGLGKSAMMSSNVSRQPSDEGPSLFVQNLPGSFADLGPLGQEVRLEAGAVLWREGDPGDHVILLVEGRLEVSHETPDGDEI